LNLIEVILAQGSFGYMPLFTVQAYAFLPFDPMEIDMADQTFTSTSPISTNDRVFGFKDQAALWFSLGVGLLVMQAGAGLMPGLAPNAALLAIAVGSAVGSVILALVARLGQETGLSSAALMTVAFGSRIGVLPVIANVVQLLGWAAFEIIIMRDGTLAVLAHSFGLEGPAFAYGIALIWGGLLLLMMLGSMTSLVRRLLSRIGLPLVLLSLVWLSWQFVSATAAKGFASFFGQEGTGELGFWGGVDLVIAMPVSWLPLIADYSRYSRTATAATQGTFFGYGAANLWCYALGALIAFNQPSGDLVTGLLIAQGGLIALSLIVLDELDNGYGDLHSGAVSSESLFGGFSLVQRGIAMALLSLALALALTALGETTSQLVTQFLTILSSVFVPLFGVILARFATIRRAVADGVQPASVEWSAVLAWAVGFAVYQVGTNIVTDWGAALPGLIVSFAIARLSESGKA
jgi:nucleobase:cation symporter-1, NCS1 family